MIPYAELQVTTNFSFLRGASHPGELVLAAAALGHAAIGVTDRNSLAGAVQMHIAAKDAGLRLVVGARIDLCRDPTRPPRRPDGRAADPDGPGVLCFPTDRAAYGRLARLISLGRRRARKGECVLGLDDLLAHAEGQVLVALPERADRVLLGTLKDAAGDRLHLAAHRHLDADDEARIARIAALARRAGVPLVVTNDVHAHAPARRPLQDVMTCIREGCTVDEAGWRLFANAERHLKSPAAMARLFDVMPDAVARSVEIADRCRFSLAELRYEYPDEVVAEGETAQQSLERLARAGARERFPAGVPDKVAAALERELRLIQELDYAPYFLTVQDIVRFAYERKILCQGRGSAANSVVCYCLGITAVDPTRVDLLFERFVSAARDEPPDIDVDFEHERREEVIQYIYARYGRERAGLAATVIRYRTRGAIRDVGKALGLSPDVVGALAGTVWGWEDGGVGDGQVRGAGLDPAEPRLATALRLAHELIGFPRHLSQHVGGFIVTRGPLDELVPIENAAMADRTVIEWDKDDIDALGILKVDVLALGMLTCVRKAFALIERHHGRKLDLAGVPPEDPAVYDMLGRADSIGVFQVESRAQMTMLARLKPRCWYDLVIEVAIVRPGPIQGDMVHPYLRRRTGQETVDYPSPELEAVLGKTLGVPLFQEQAMRIAIVAAGFTPEDADRLRRAMATFRHTGTIHTFREKMIEGMVARNYERDFAERCFRQIEGFGTYGFPESHAASFALLVYVSAWIKCRHPAVFAAALLNSQPMGFYAPAQIVRDAREHGVEVRPVDVNASAWDCTLETAGPEASDPLALRLGFRMVKGLAVADTDRLVAARGNGYGSVAALRRRGGLGRGALERLAEADAFRSAGLDRRRALWEVQRLRDAPLPLFDGLDPDEAAPEPRVELPAMPLSAHVVRDYVATGLSLKRHPLAFLRERLAALGIVPNAQLRGLPHGRRVRVAGLVLVRQRPGSAKGVIFATLEDETGIANVVVWPDVFERFRPVVLGARLMMVAGPVQREGEVIHVVAERPVDLSHELVALDEETLAADAHPDAGTTDPPLPVASRDFR